MALLARQKGLRTQEPVPIEPDTPYKHHTTSSACLRILFVL